MTGSARMSLDNLAPRSSVVAFGAGANDGCLISEDGAMSLHHLTGRDLPRPLLDRSCIDLEPGPCFKRHVMPSQVWRGTSRGVLRGNPRDI